VFICGSFLKSIQMDTDKHRSGKKLTSQYRAMISPKTRIIIATDECGYSFEAGTRPDDIGLDIHELDSLKELTEMFVEDGLFGDIPENFRFGRLAVTIWVNTSQEGDITLLRHRHRLRIK